MVGLQNKINLHCHKPVTVSVSHTWAVPGPRWRARGIHAAGVKGADLAKVRMPLTTFQEALIAKCCHRIVIEYGDSGRISDLP